MKKIVLLVFFCSFGLTHAQDKKCSIDYEIKNDSTDFIKLNDQLIFEKNFLDKSESLYFSLMRNNNEKVLQFQWLEKSKDFTINKCFDATSDIRIDLINSDHVILKIYDNEICSQLIYDDVAKNNIRVLNTYFKIEPADLNKLLKSKISLLTVNFSTGKEYYNIQDKLTSENSKVETTPALFFMNEIPCLK